LGPAEQAAAARRGAALFRLEEHGALVVSGGDRVRWLDGMLTCDVARLAAAGRAVARALALTRKGQIVADLCVWAQPAGLWLETERAALAGLFEHLRRHVAADDVEIAGPDEERALLALEGPAAAAVLERAAPGTPLPGVGGVAPVAIGGAEVALAGLGESAFRVALPAALAERVEAALLAAGAPLGLVRGSREAREILRVEAGVPGFATELAQGLLPAEARLEAAICFDKGCYTGQEIVARVASRAQIRRVLAGLRLAGPSAPEPGAGVLAGGEEVGRVTSGALSPAVGAIALALLRISHASPGTELRVGPHPARVVPLPFVAPGARPG